MIRNLRRFIEILSGKFNQQTRPNHKAGKPLCQGVIPPVSRMKIALFSFFVFPLFAPTRKLFLARRRPNRFQVVTFLPKAP
jgi:hypothetical protein